MAALPSLQELNFQVFVHFQFFVFQFVVVETVFCNFGFVPIPSQFQTKNGWPDEADPSGQADRAGLAWPAKRVQPGLGRA